MAVTVYEFEPYVTVLGIVTLPVYSPLYELYAAPLYVTVAVPFDVLKS